MTGQLLHLDQFAWVELARAKRSKDGPYAAILEALLDLTGRGLLSVPLSAANYLELWNRQSWKSRVAVGEVMRDVSRYATLLALFEVQDREVREAVNSIKTDGLVRKAVIPREEILGFGVNHAFNSETGRWRFVESIARDGVPEGAPIPADADFLAGIEKLGSERWEWFNLVGLEELYSFGDLEIRPEHRLGDLWVEMQQKIAAVLDTSSDPTFPDRYLCHLELEDLAPVILGYFGSSSAMSRYFTGPEAGFAFVRAVPTAYAESRLLRFAHKNTSYMFRQHDKTDVITLSHVLPYVDALVADKHWTAMARAGRLDDVFGTTLIRRPVDLLNWLATI